MATSSALVGHTGFVGNSLVVQNKFDKLFNSKNIEAIAGGSFDLLVISGMPAAMWIANKDPSADLAVLDRLTGCLRQTRAEQVVVMSTVAVYPVPVGASEDSQIDDAAQTPYGRHRFALERRLRDHFPRVLSVRLPGLFGPGLKKNAVYDLLHNNDTHKVHAASVYQFYNLERLWADVSVALAAGLDLINFATEPVSIRDVAREAFGLDFTNDPGTPPAFFDVRSRHAVLYGGHDGYLYGCRQVLDELREFVRRERTAGAPT